MKYFFICFCNTRWRRNAVQCILLCTSIRSGRVYLLTVWGETMMQTRDRLVCCGKDGVHTIHHKGRVFCILPVFSQICKWGCDIEGVKSIDCSPYGVD